MHCKFLLAHRHKGLILLIHLLLVLSPMLFRKPANPLSCLSLNLRILRPRTKSLPCSKPLMISVKKRWHGIMRYEQVRRACHIWQSLGVSERVFNWIKYWVLAYLSKVYKHLLLVLVTICSLVQIFTLPGSWFWTGIQVQVAFTKLTPKMYTTCIMFTVLLWCQNLALSRLSTVC